MDYFATTCAACISLTLIQMRDVKIWSIVGHINYSDTNIGRTEIAEVADLARGCSPTHILIANRQWSRSDIAFWWYFTRNTSVRRLQFSGRMIGFLTTLTVGVQNLHQFSNVDAARTLTYSSKSWQQTSCLTVYSSVLFFRSSTSILGQFFTIKYHKISMLGCFW